MRRSLRISIATALISTLPLADMRADQKSENMSSQIDIYQVYNDLPIIFWRIKEENYAAVDQLLMAGADIETRGFFGMTPLMTAANAESWGMAKFLIERGADVSTYAGNGASLPHKALTSRVLPDSPNGRNLQFVRSLLKERGLYDKVATPAELRAQMEAGTLPRPPYFDAWRAENWPADANARADKIRGK